MTEQQIKLLDFVRDRIEATGIAPSYAEMADHLGHKSKSATFYMVDRLVRDGALVRSSFKRERGLRLPGPNLAAVRTRALVAELERRKAAA